MSAAVRTVLLDRKLLRHGALVLGSHVVVSAAVSTLEHELVAHDPLLAAFLDPFALCEK